MVKLKGARLAQARKNIKKAQAASRKIRAKAKAAGSRARAAGRKIRRKVSRKRKTTTSNNPTRPKKKSNSSKRQSNGMVFGKKIPLLSNPTVRKIFIASGAASIIGTVVSFVAPSFAAQVQTPIAKAIIGFLTGDIVGAAANFILPTIAGGAAQSSNGGNGGNFA